MSDHPLPSRVSPRDDALLTEAAAGDIGRLRALRARVAAGEPAAYAAGFLNFRGRRFAIDSRAYITDPELTHLIDAVLEEGDELTRRLGRLPVVLEFGAGAGTLALSLQLERPEWTVIGLDIDAAALELAKANAARHGVALPLLQSDMLDGWPRTLRAPDLIFGDPPWGSETDLYADDRDAAYYHRMPPLSAYPGGENPCALHDQLLAAVREKGWHSQLVLNYGVLAPSAIERSSSALRDRRCRHPTPALTIVSGYVTPAPRTT